VKDRLIRLALALVTILLLIRFGPAIARGLVGLGRGLAGVLVVFHPSALLVIGIVVPCIFLIRSVVRSRSSRRRQS
jgi:hypothetical protein